MEPSTVASEAMKKIVAALKKLRYQAVAIGEAAHDASGCPRTVQTVDLLTNTGEKQRLAILAAGKQEGLAPGEAPAGQLRLLHKTVPIRMLEAATPFHRLMLTRAQPGVVLGVRSLLATPEDLILMRIGSEAPADRATVLQLFRAHGTKLDATYLQVQAEAVGRFDKLKAAWKESQAK